MSRRRCGQEASAAARSQRQELPSGWRTSSHHQSPQTATLAPCPVLQLREAHAPCPPSIHPTTPNPRPLPGPTVTVALYSGSNVDASSSRTPAGPEKNSTSFSDSQAERGPPVYVYACVADSVLSCCMSGVASCCAGVGEYATPQEDTPTMPYLPHHTTLHAR